MMWVTFFRKTFEKEVANSINWGDLAPQQVTVGDTVYNTVGYVGVPAGQKVAPKIEFPCGKKIRIKVGYFFYADANATGSVALYIVFYKNGDTARDPDGNDLHGVVHSLGSAQSSALYERHELLLEYDGVNKITWYLDGNQAGETTLEEPLVSFAVVLETKEATNGDIGILLYEVTADYWYEELENMFYMILYMFLITIVVLTIMYTVKRTIQGAREETVEEQAT